MFYSVTAGIFVALAITLAALIIRSLHFALAENSTSIALKTGMGLFAWLILLAILSQTGFVLDFQSMPPQLLTILLPPFILLLILLNSKKIGRLIQLIPPERLIYIQSFRVLMEIILWMLFLDNVIPVPMTFEGRNFDVLVGLTAPLIGYLCFTKKIFSPKIALYWNIFGLLLLANIVITAILSTPFPFRVFMNEPANTIIAYWPFVWLPGFVVPVAYTMHALSIKQLLNRP